jgi:hypothetical protein
VEPPGLDLSASDSVFIHIRFEGRRPGRALERARLAVSGWRPAPAKPQVTGVIGVSDPYRVAKPKRSSSPSSILASGALLTASAVSSEASAIAAQVVGPAAARRNGGVLIATATERRTTCRLTSSSIVSMSKGFWEAIERNVVAAMHQNARRGGTFKGWKVSTEPAALEWRTNTLFEDIVLGSVAAFSWAYLVPFLVGRPPSTELTLTFGIYMQLYMLGAGYELVYGGHIPTRDTHSYDPVRNEFVPRGDPSDPLSPSHSPLVPTASP